MAGATAEAPTARLKARYLDEIRPALIERFGYTSVMQAPRVEKITLNMGVGMAKQDSKMLKAATEQLATIAGQQPSVRRARKSIAAFKLREGMPVGVAVTLRGDRAYEFFDRLVTIAIPRIRDFRGLNARSFDGRGNYSMGVREQIIFPEIDYDAIDQVRGMDITISTNAATDAEAFALLQAMGMPFAAQGRPRGFDPQADEAEAQARAAAAAEKAQAPATPAAPAKAAKTKPEPQAASAPEADEPQAAGESKAAEPEAAEPAATTEPEQAAAEADDDGADDAQADTQAQAETAEGIETAEADGGAEQAAQESPQAEGDADAQSEAEAEAPQEQAADSAEKESSD